MRGEEIWDAAEKGTKTARSANLMRFYALGRMLDAAETSALSGCDIEAAEQLRELQAHCEKLIAVLAPEQKKPPKLVTA
jgi:hypothetical protein